jgi:hypothetical protein
MKPDLKDAAIETFEAFAKRCDGHTNIEVFAAFICLAAKAAFAAAELLDKNRPNAPHCALCRASDIISDAAHALIETRPVKEDWRERQAVH